MRRRRPEPDSALSKPPATAAGPLKGGEVADGSVAVRTAFFLLLACRLTSAAFNIIHDCDEVYNYWEPLHYLLYGSGMQTWEYSSEFALRSYVYLLLHAVIAGPAALLFGSGTGKLWVFFLTKAGLGLASAASETLLYRAARDHVSPTCAHYLLALLCCSSGMFTSSTSLLPSSFTMYFVTLAATAVLAGRPLLVVVSAVVGVIWGWTVAGLAFLPYAFYVLATANFGLALGTGLLSLAVTLAAVVGLDAFFYGKWTVSLWNFVQYNVIGGGDSALYGVEGPSFYIRNGLLNLNLILPLGLISPLVLALTCGREVKLRLLVSLSPIWVWLAGITALPHKEERFLYVVYPLLCLSAAATLAAAPALVRRVLGAILPRRPTAFLAVSLPRAMIALIAVLSLSRTLALILNYSAPMYVYRQLPALQGVKDVGDVSLVCVGDEWHRFPSAFFLPSARYRLAFVKSGFNGLLPRPFDLQEGGTAAAPAQLNDRNREEPLNYLPDASTCDFFVGLQEAGAPPPAGEGTWAVRASAPFVDVSRSPSQLARALYIPWFSARRNFWLNYVLLERER